MKYSEWGKEPIVVTDMDEAPKIDQYRDTRIKYAESIGDASKTLDVDTFVTYGELRELCKILMGVDA